MNGRTHKAIGVAVGAAMTIYGVGTENPFLAFGMISSPLGAMLPDVDHNSTKLGRGRKQVVKIIRACAVIAIILSLIVGLSYGLISDKTTTLKLLIAVVPTALAVLIATSEKFKKKFPFLANHRGIMHTLVLPVLMLVGSMMLKPVVLNALMCGLALGYVSHIYADSLTKMGCPLAFPLSKKCYHFMPVITGTIWEYIVASILCVIIVVYGYVAQKGLSYILVLFIPFLAIDGYAFVESIMKNLVWGRKNPKMGARVKTVLLVVSIGLVIVGVVFKTTVVRLVTISVGLGMLFAIIKLSRSGSHERHGGRCPT